MDPMQIAILVAIFGIMYMMVIRPQQQRDKAQKKFAEELKKGDQVVTNGGIVGKISAIDGEFITLSLDGKTTCTFVKSAVNHELTQSLNKKDDAKK